MRIVVCNNPGLVCRGLGIVSSCDQVMAMEAAQDHSIYYLERHVGRENLEITRDGDFKEWTIGRYSHRNLVALLPHEDTAFVRIGKMLCVERHPQSMSLQQAVTLMYHAADAAVWALADFEERVTLEVFNAI